MRYIAAYLLAVLGGNESPKVADLKKILSSVGVDINEERLNAVVSELEGKDVDEIIAQGSEKLAKFGGAAPAGGAAAGDAGAAAPAEEKKEEVEEEEADLGGGMDMFGGGDDY